MRQELGKASKPATTEAQKVRTSGVLPRGRRQEQQCKERNPAESKRSEGTNLNTRHTTNWVPVPLFEQRPITGLASSARRADTTFDVAELADRRVLSLVAFEDRWRDLIGACKSPTQFCPPSIRDRKPLPKERH